MSVYIKEPTLESLIEELSFEDGEKEAESLLKERTEKTALLEELYRKKTGTTKPCSLEMLQVWCYSKTNCAINTLYVFRSGKY